MASKSGRSWSKFFFANDRTVEQAERASVFVLGTHPSPSRAFSGGVALQMGLVLGHQRGMAYQARQGGHETRVQGSRPKAPIRIVETADVAVSQGKHRRRRRSRNTRNMRNERIKTKRTKRAGWGADGGYNEGPTYTSKKLLSFSGRLRV